LPAFEKVARRCASVIEGGKPWPCRVGFWGAKSFSGFKANMATTCLFWGGQTRGFHDIWRWYAGSFQRWRFCELFHSTSPFGSHQNLGFLIGHPTAYPRPVQAIRSISPQKNHHDSSPSNCQKASYLHFHMKAKLPWLLGCTSPWSHVVQWYESLWIARNPRLPCHESPGIPVFSLNSWDWFLQKIPQITRFFCDASRFRSPMGGLRLCLFYP
jgi:hypothetical protein